MRWSWRGTRRRCGRRGSGRWWPWFRCFGHDGESEGLLVQVFNLLIFEGRRQGGVLCGAQLQERFVEFAVYAALLDNFVEDLDGRPAVLCHGDAELAQVSAGVDGQAPLTSKLRVTHLTLQAADCKRGKIRLLETVQKW